MPTPSRTVRVFLSSTFRDFIQERDELVKRVFPELRRKCRERLVELVADDLRWRIIEEERREVATNLNLNQTSALGSGSGYRSYAA